MADRQARARRQHRIDAGLWAATAGLAMLTLLFSFGPSPPGAGTFAFADTLGHGAMYFATFVCFLLAAVWRPGRCDGSFPNGGLIFAIGVVFSGVAVEMLQEMLTSDRRAELGDVVAETMGAGSAFVIHSWMRRARAQAA